MAAELQIRAQGFPQLLRELGVSSPQIGPFWGLSTLVSPVYLVGANAEVSTTTPRFVNTQIFNQNVSNAVIGTPYNVGPSLFRGRYVFDLVWSFRNQDAANRGDIYFQLRDAAGTARLFVFLDEMDVSTSPRSSDRNQSTFTCDIQSDGWTASYVVLGAGNPNPSFCIFSQKFHRYAEIALEPEQSTF